MIIERDGNFVDLTLDEGQFARAWKLAADWQYLKDEHNVEDLHVRDPISGVLTGFGVHLLALCGHLGAECYLSGKLIVLEGLEGLTGREFHEDMHVPHADGRSIPVAVVATQGAMRDFLIPYTKKREFLTSAVTVLAWCNPRRMREVQLAGWITPDDWLGNTNKRVQSQFGVLGYHANTPTWHYKWFNGRSTLLLPDYFGRSLP